MTRDMELLVIRGELQSAYASVVRSRTGLHRLNAERAVFERLDDAACAIKEAQAEIDSEIKIGRPEVK